MAKDHRKLRRARQLKQSQHSEASGPRAMQKSKQPGTEYTEASTQHGRIIGVGGPGGVDGATGVGDAGGLSSVAGRRNQAA